jgi:O-antigen/teichoic acid export membrane protein
MPGDFGDVTKIYAYTAFLNVVYAFGLETTYFRFASNKAFTQEEKDRQFSQAFTLIFALSGTVSLLLFFNADWLATQINYEGYGLYVRWMGLTILMDALALLPFARLRLENKMIKFVTIRLIGVTFTIIFNAFFLLLYRPAALGQFGADWKDRLAPFFDPTLAGPGYVFLANLLANGLMFSLLLPELRKIKLIWDGELVKKYLSYAWPLLIMGLAGMTDEMFSRLILENYLPKGFYPNLTNKEALGIFGACYKLSIFMSLAIQAFRYAADPFFFGKGQDKNAPEVFAKVMHAFIIVCLGLFLVVSLNVWWIAPLFIRKQIYLSGLNIVPILLLANMCLGIYYNLTVWFKLTDKTQYGTYIGVFGMVLTILANLALIPLWGYTGSAMATLVCYASMCIACYFIGQRYFPIPYTWLRSAYYLVIAVLLVGMQQYFGIHWAWWLKSGYFLGALFAYAVLILQVERLSVRQLLAQVRKR